MQVPQQQVIYNPGIKQPITQQVSTTTSQEVNSKQDQKLRYFPPYQKKKSSAPGPAPTPGPVSGTVGAPRLQLKNANMTNTAPQTVQSQYTA